MARKQDEFYFDNFIACADFSCQAADMLQKVLTTFSPLTLEKCMEELHNIEHSADMKKHEMMEALAKSFITPIEREDILELSQNIDDVTDSIEDVLQRVYMNNVTAIRPEATAFADILCKACQALLSTLKEFKDFKRSKEIAPLIVRINELEEEADRLFIKSMRALHTQEKNALEVLAWRDILIFLEKCADACEHAADVVESVIMKNT